MRTLKLTLCYDGANYAGWQSQPGQLTIQGLLENAFAKVTGEQVNAVGSGRTDSGVHALAQVASIDTESALAPERLVRALNTHLPEDIAVLAVEDVRPGFHAIRDAVRKRYRYLIHDGAVRGVFSRHFAWQYRQRLDAEQMHRSAQALVGTHDFRSFESHWPNRESSIRTVLALTVERESTAPHHVVIEIEADGFLYNMVRAIVGTLVDVGRGAKPVTWAGEVLSALDRSVAGMTAPAHGLFLAQVWYDGREHAPADSAVTYDAGCQ